MTSQLKYPTLLSCVLGALIAAAAQAQQVTDVVGSDYYGNTAMGDSALELIGPRNCAAGIACYNTAAGAGSLYDNSTGNANSAFGFQTLNSNSKGTSNAAMGYRALFKNQSGINNSALGANALYSNTSGGYNAAFGTNALYSNTGSYNAAFGVDSLLHNSTGYENVAVGYEAMQWNTQGYNDTAVGFSALIDNVSGSENSAVGMYSLFNNQSGDQNTAFGVNALSFNSSGSNNTALGYNAGGSILGSNNVDVASFGSETDNGVMRIGTAGQQNSIYISGIENSKVTGNEVFVTSSGQLGVKASAERYKTRIATMDTMSAKLTDLRPVTFHLKTEPHGEVQYGLIAEEVVKVYPELVIRNDAGVIQGVRYDELAPMLLNELQKLQRKVDAQDAKLAKLEQTNATLQAALLELLPKPERVAAESRPAHTDF